MKYFYTLCIILVLAAFFGSGNNTEGDATKKLSPVVIKKSEIDLLLEGEPDLSISPIGDLADIFKIGSEYTDIQRSNTLKDLKDKIVVWRLTVYNINKSGKKYVIQTEPKGIKSDEVSTVIILTLLGEDQIPKIESLKTADKINIKGRLTGDSTFRSIEIKPAILLNN